MKGPLDQLTILFKLLRKSALEEAVTGKVRKLKRPANSTLEDVAINTLPVTTDQVQQGVANVNIYVPDLLIDQQYEADLARLNELTQLAVTLLKGLYTQEYSLQLGKQTLIEEPQTHCHYMNLRVNFQFFS